MAGTTSAPAHNLTRTTTMSEQTTNGKIEQTNGDQAGAEQAPEQARPHSLRWNFDEGAAALVVRDQGQSVAMVLSLRAGGPLVGPGESLPGLDWLGEEVSARAPEDGRILRHQGLLAKLRDAHQEEAALERKRQRAQLDRAEALAGEGGKKFAQRVAQLDADLKAAEQELAATRKGVALLGKEVKAAEGDADRALYLIVQQAATAAAERLQAHFQVAKARVGLLLGDHLTDLAKLGLGYRRLNAPTDTLMADMKAVVNEALQKRKSQAFPVQAEPQAQQAQTAKGPPFADRPQTKVEMYDQPRR
jgi:hypothetical protein